MGNAKILIIEDEEHIREEVVDWLIFEGYDVLSAPNGRDGTSLAIKEQPDLIICDISMPHMTGHEVLLEVRSNPHLTGTIFIFLTASAGRAIQRKSMELGADDYITKPFTHSEVMTAVNTQFAKRSRRDKELQAQLNLMQISLESEREQRLLRSRLVGMFSHDFRTPLSLIMMSASLIRNYEDRLSQERKLEKFDQIINSSKQLVQMLDDMLFAVEMGSDQFRYRAETINLSAQIEEIVSDFRELYSETHTIVFDSAFSQSMEMDSKLLRQIATNLISNAIKYSSSGTTVWVDLKADGKEIELKVRDEGAGIPEESIQFLFEPFHRAENTKMIKGTGLGLAIVRQAIDFCGGRVKIESEVGVGSTFFVYFPLILR